LDDALRIKVFNSRIRDLFALTNADIGRPLSDLMSKYGDPTLGEDAHAARLTGTPSVREIQGAGESWYVRSVLPYRTKANEIRGAVVTFADVTALKQAELASASARKYAETIVDIAREPLAVIDADMRVESMNSAFCAAMNLRPERAMGKRLQDLDRPLLAHPSLIELMVRVLDARTETDGVELEIEGHTGEQRMWKAHVRGFRSAPSDRSLILLALEDITEQRRIVRHQLQLLIDALPEPIIAVDSRRYMRLVSRHMETLFGYQPTELVGEKIDILLPPDLREKNVSFFKKFTAKPSVRGMGTGLDVHGVRKDGARIPLDIGLSPITTVDGPLIVAALHDLRTLREGEDRMRAAKAAADRANQAKTRFLAAASHDLRQPLQTIGLLLGVLEKRIADAETRGTLLRLDDAVAHMTELVDTLLDINHIESGGIKVEVAELSVGALISRAADDYTPLAAAKGIELRLIRSSAMVRSDRRLLARVIGNLVSNAIKYTDKGKVVIGCRRRGSALRIEIWDSGIGIPPDSIDAVFDEFYRVDHADASKFGLGLGLYIVKRFVELLGHKIEVRSVPGKGTMFAVIVAQPVFASNGVASTADTIHAHSCKPIVLLVEDDQTQLDALSALFALEGYRVITARDGKEALTRIHGDAALRPSVIVVDYNLPGKLNGVDVIRHVRGIAGAAIPALLVSGNRPAVTLETAEFADFLFLAKPVKAVSLVTTVNTLIARSMPDWRPPKHPVGTTDRQPSRATDRPQIAVIDDEPGVREAVREILFADGYGAATFPSSEAFLADPDHGRFDCVLSDISLPGMDGLELQRRLKTEGNASPPIIFVTGNLELPIAVEAMREGAANFLQKPVDRATICESVARALKAAAGPESSPAFDRAEVAARISTLTDRERQVLKHIVAGDLNKNIAATLGISQRTTEHHRQSVMRKMGVKSLAMLVRMVGGLTSADGDPRAP
jgi:PAS domain S-box-containing protein